MKFQSDPGHTFQKKIAIPEENIKAMKELLAKEEGMLRSEPFKSDDYFRGLYNGMEYMLATMEGRKPSLKLKMISPEEDGG